MELVAYTAYVAIRYGVDTKEFASAVITYWEMLSPCGHVLFEFTRSYELSLPHNAMAEFKLGCRWEDVPTN